MSPPTQPPVSKPKSGTPRMSWGRRLATICKLLRETMFVKQLGESHRPLSPPPGELGLTFLGHAGFLAEVNDKRLLFDPVLSDWLVLIKRLRKPGVRAEDLPAVDWVFLSHAHMDHLDRRTLRKVISGTREQTGQAPGVVLPENCSDLVRDLGFREIIVLRWWQQIQLGPLLVTHTPVKHWGARTLYDTHRGFGGYLVEGHGHSLYHAGDSAYFAGFREIGERLHPRLALLPIGAYSPDSYRGAHESPEEALQAFVDLGADSMVPMHYGTFRLSEEPMEEPVQRLLAASQRAGLDDRVHVLSEGRTEFFAPVAERKLSVT